MPTEVRRPGVDPVLQVVRVLGARGPMTRAALGEATGLSRTTVSGLLMDLRRRGMVADVRDELATPTGGRVASLVALEPAAGLAVGVDVGRTHVSVVLVDGGHRVLDRQTVTVEVDQHADETLEIAASLVLGALATAGASTGDVLGIGLGIPAPLDSLGRVGSSSILPGWVGRSPGNDLARRLCVPVRAENDANLGALAETVWGAARDRRIVVYIKAATGIGAGLVIAGQLFRGATGTAGELGHTTVSDGGGVCRCGNRGCLELVAGGAALIAQVEASGQIVTGVSDLVAKAHAGDPSCRRVLADAGDHLGLAVANVVNLFNPDVVVFGGELGLAGDLILNTMRARVLRSAPSAAGAAVQIVPAVLGNRAESYGGALLVLREVAEGAAPIARLLATA